MKQKLNKKTKINKKRKEAKKILPILANILKKFFNHENYNTLQEKQEIEKRRLNRDFLRILMSVKYAIRKSWIQKTKDL